MNKLFSICTAVVLTQAITFSVYAYVPSRWAQEDIEQAKQEGITAFADFDKKYTDTVTRDEICTLILQTINICSNETATPKNESPFTDTSSEDVLCAYEMGIIDGTGDGRFLPEKQVTRQEASKIFMNALSLFEKNKTDDSNESAKKFSDFDKISNWAVNYVSLATDNELFKGDENGNFNPNNGVTVEQSAIICLRLLNNMKSEDNIIPPSNNGDKIDSPIVSDLNILIKTEKDTATISWNSDENCSVTISEQRNSYYENEFKPNITKHSGVRDGMDISINPNKTYTVTVLTDTGETDSKAFVTDNFTIDKEHRENVKEVVNTFTSDEDASKQMETITVRVWQIKDGEKYASEMSLTVYKEIAEKVKAVFEEIFNGDEKFPIYTLGAYAWRAPMSSGRYSEHNFGTAIDINPNDNYCLYSNGSIVGDCYKPYENPYSITPYGDVIKAFEKYGFTWGGDSWKSPKDYMHFSYLGT